ncbi:hypothetical protein ACHAQA_006597 [Verticillium albo-atrum]
MAGSTIAQVSSTAPEYSSRLARLVQGEVSNAPTGTHLGRFQLAQPGSYGVVDSIGLSSEDDGVEVSLLVLPTLLDAAHDQTIFTLLDTESETTRFRGLAAVIAIGGRLKLLVGNGEPGEVRTLLLDFHFVDNQWVSLKVRAVGSTVQATVEPTLYLSQRRGQPFRYEIQLVKGNIAIPEVPSLVIAALRPRPDGSATDFYNGRIEGIQVASINGRDTRILVKLDLSLGMSSDTIVDVSGYGRHGRLVNAPTRAVRGHDWDGSETDWTKAAYGYGAIHFHEDDLDDAR